MEQKITIRIAGKDFVLKASSPEEEELIRLAALSWQRKLEAAQGEVKDLSDTLGGYLSELK